MQEKTSIFAGLSRPSITHALRTAVAGMLSLYLADLFKLPESYWAAITTLIVMQSTLGDTLKVSGQRLVGTAIGACIGALLATHFPESLWIFGGGVFAVGMICALLRLHGPATALAGVTLALVVLVGRENTGARIALHRFIEVSLGVVVALALTAAWPEAKATVMAAK